MSIAKCDIYKKGTTSHITGRNTDKSYLCGFNPVIG